MKKNNHADDEQTLRWNDQDSTILLKKDYDKLIQSLTKNDTSLDEFKQTFSSLKLKPKDYDELGAMGALYGILLSKSLTDTNNPEQKAYNINVKQNILFNRFKGDLYAFTCATTTAPINSWYAFHSNGQVKQYYFGTTNHHWKLENDTLYLFYSNKTMKYLDQDSVFKPVPKGHPLYVIYRNKNR